MLCLFAAPQRVRLYDHRCAAALFELCVAARAATVTDVSGNIKQRWAPVSKNKNKTLFLTCNAISRAISNACHVITPQVPLNTLEMQKRACAKLRLSPEAVMKVAEELYQNGFISYPRTETDSFPTDLDLRAIVGKHVVL